MGGHGGPKEIYVKGEVEEPTSLLMEADGTCGEPVPDVLESQAPALCVPELWLLQGSSGARGRSVIR